MWTVFGNVAITQMPHLCCGTGNYHRTTSKSVMPSFLAIRKRLNHILVPVLNRIHELVQLIIFRHRVSTGHLSPQHTQQLHSFSRVLSLVVQISPPCWLSTYLLNTTECVGLEFSSYQAAQMSTVVCEPYPYTCLLLDTYVRDISVSDMWKPLYYTLFIPPL